MINEVRSEAKERNIDFSVTDEARKFLIDKGYDSKNGARPLRRVIQRYIEDELAEMYLSGKIKAGSHVIFECESGEKLINKVL